MKDRNESSVKSTGEVGRLSALLAASAKSDKSRENEELLLEDGASGSRDLYLGEETKLISDVLHMRWLVYDAGVR